MNGNGKVARSLTLVLTNVIKLSGLIVALHELLFRGALRPVAVAVAAFMMAGAQLSEQAILAVVDRVISSADPEKATKPQ